MKRFIQLTYGSGDKVWVDVDSISAVSEYNGLPSSDEYLEERKNGNTDISNS
jgi:hypothetical protein